MISHPHRPPRPRPRSHRSADGPCGRDEDPEGICGFLVGIYRYALRVEAYVGLLTGAYPPFQLAAETGAWQAPAHPGLPSF